MIPPASSGRRGKAETHFPRAGLSWWASLPLAWEPGPGQWVTRAGALGTGWRPHLRFPQTQGAWGLGGYGGALAAPGAQYPKKTSTLAPPGLASPFMALIVTGHPWGVESAGLPPPQHSSTSLGTALGTFWVAS